MTNPNRTATIGTKAFENLKPGDKFAISRGKYAEVVAVCVRPPQIVHERRWFTFWKPTTYKAVGVELHEYLGACEWYSTEPKGTVVELLQVVKR